MAPSPMHPQPRPQGTPERNSCGGGGSLAQLVPQCNGTYGQEGGGGLAWPDGAPPVEDVMRWKEFRRRQKMESQQQQWQGEVDERQQASARDFERYEQTQQQQHQQQQQQSGQRKSLGDKLGGDGAAAGEPPLPHLDSLSLSLSSSTTGRKSQASGGHPTTEEAGPKEKGPLEIDREGFPISPTSEEAPLSALSPASMVSDELRKAKSAESDLCHSPEVEQLNQFFTSLDVTVDAVRKEHQRNGSFETKPSVDGAAHGRAGEENASSEAPSAMPTEITSNTARYLADQSNLLARRMMSATAPSLVSSTASTAHSAGSTAAPSSAAAGISAGLASLTVNTAPTPPSSSGGPPKMLTPVEKSTVDTPSPADVPPGMPRLLTPKTSHPSGAAQPGSAKAASDRMRLAATPAGRPMSSSVASASPMGNSPGWDPTTTTVRSDLLERVLATPNDQREDEVPLSPSMEPILEPAESDEGEPGAEEEQGQGEADVSMVSSNWDPLHVSTLGEDESVEETTSEAQKPKSSPSEKSMASQQSAASKNVPTLDEVHSFLTQLKQLQKENPSPDKTKDSPVKQVEGMDYLPAADESEVVLNEESVEFNKSLLERKERLKKYKTEGDRKKKEREERLKAMRSKVYTEASGDGDTANAESKPSELPTGKTPLNNTPATPADKIRESEFPTDEKATSKDRPLPSFSPMVPCAQWSGGLARWSPNNAPSPAQQPSPLQRKKLNIGVDEDDFSFKPPSVPGGNGTGSGIPISPIVAAGAAGHSFTFDNAESSKKSPDKAGRFDLASSLEKAATSPVGTLLKTIGTAASGAAAASRRSRSSESPSGRSALADVGNAASPGLATTVEDGHSSTKGSSPRKAPFPSISRSQSPLAPSASPDMSEGDRSGGIGFNPTAAVPSAGYMRSLGDRSIVSRTSSNFVELGLNISSQDPPEEDEEGSHDSESLLGVTIKQKKKKKKRSPRELANRLVKTLDSVDEASKGSISTHDNSAEENECHDASHDNANAPSAAEGGDRKPLDPDGFDWKELEAEKRAENERTIARIKQAQSRRRYQGGKLKGPSLDIVPEHGEEDQILRRGPIALSLDVGHAGDNEEYAAVMDRVKTCLTPRGTSIDDMGITSSHNFLTPRSVQSEGFNFGGRKAFVPGGASSINELRSKFETESGSPKPLSTAEARARFEPKSDRFNRSYNKKEEQQTENNQQDFARGPLNRSGGAAPRESLPELYKSTSKEQGDIAVPKSKSSDSVSIKELRSKFESRKGQDETQKSTQGTSQQSGKFVGSIAVGGTSTMIGSGVYLKNRDIQAMSSLGSSTHDTAESSLVKSETNEGTIGDRTLGDGTLDTNKVLRYAKRLESREVRADSTEGGDSLFDDIIDKKDTSITDHSSKENHNSGKKEAANAAPAPTKVTSEATDFTSPVKLRKLAFEGNKKKDPKVAQTLAKYQQLVNTPERKRTSMTPKKDVPTPDTAAAGPAHAIASMQGESPATSVKDRIAVFTGKNSTTTSNRALPIQQASPNRALPLQQHSSSPPRANIAGRTAQQQARSPPRTIATNHAKSETPSPLWIAQKRGGGQGYSPNRAQNGPRDKASPLTKVQVPLLPMKLPTSPPLNTQGMSNQAHQRKALRPTPVTTRYESPIAREQYEDDEEDGITLSPTFSEVSGLTIPTCLDGGDGASRVSMQSDAFDNMSKGGNLFHETMSPIARHRRQQERKGHSYGDAGKGGKMISKHPYLQRVNKTSSQQDALDALNSNFADSMDRLHELKTPRARGSPGVSQGTSALPTQSPGINQRGNNPKSHREKIVSRVRSSPRNKSYAQNSTNNPHSSRMNSISEVNQTSISQSFSSDKSPIRHFDGRNDTKSAKPTGTVAERVDKVNKKMKRQSNQYSRSTRPSRDRYHSDRRAEDPNSLATQDCIRVD